MTSPTSFLARCAVVAVLPLAAVGCTSTSSASGPSGAPPASPSSAAPAATAASGSSGGLPQSAAPLPTDEMVWRHRSEQTWSISTVDTKGLTGAELVVGQSNRAASLSRDRRTVLYLRREDGDRTSLRAVSADGRSDTRLFADGSTDCPKLRRPALGPNGTIAVVCSAYDEGDDDVLNVMRTDGTLVKQLDHGQIGDPTFNGDGSMLVYARDRYTPYPYGGALFATPVDGSRAPNRLVAGRNLNPVWSPTGDEVAYVHLDGRRLSIAAVRVSDDGQRGGTQALTTGDGYDQDPSWSPDGSRIVFRRGSREPHLFVMRSDGGSVRRVVRSPGPVTAPVWSAR